MEVHSRDQRDLDQGARLFTWARFVSKGIGVWPLEPNYYIFNICIIYGAYIMITEYIDLYYCLPNLKKVINNLTESLAFTQMYLRAVLLRIYIKKFHYLMSEALKDYHVSAYKNSDEVYEFMGYVKKGRFFVKAVTIFVISTTSSWFLRPITSSTPATSMSAPDNETAAKFTYILPYKFHIFYEINNYRTYVLTYISHGPFPYVIALGAITSAVFLIILSFHVSGRLAILARRINALNCKNDGFRTDLTDIISEHTRLLQMGEEIRGSYAVALLLYIIVGTIQLCIIGYQILVLIAMGKQHSLMPYFVFILTTYLLISIYCILSEHLLAESEKVSESFYSCEWYDMPQDCIKDISFCILRSQKTLGLTAGAFITFSNSTLTDVTKTSMGYLSILRNFLLNEQ
ncbi:odorant receptor 85b-like [Microplitis demolitor]|uniref:odorant receptor 85b-like n=1 Tax=Microplitis demolitor TaxID=69319 RepID=UPI0006D50FC9|nr:odorant receptor 85b-like [Microplitis demolitor]